jgi:hypothetical protein
MLIVKGNLHIEVGGNPQSLKDLKIKNPNPFALLNPLHFYYNLRRFTLPGPCEVRATNP